MTAPLEPTGGHLFKKRRMIRRKRDGKDLEIPEALAGKGTMVNPDATTVERTVRKLKKAPRKD